MSENFLIIAMGSKDINKFSPDQQVDLVEYLIKIIEIKILLMKETFNNKK